MRIDIPPAILEHLGGDATNIAICWCIEKNNGEFIRGTEHDQDITVDPTGESPPSDLEGVYPAGANIRASSSQTGSEMAPATMNVEGAIPIENSESPAVVDYIDVTVADIEAGLLNQAAVQVFFVNWAAPNDGQVVIRRGYLGDLARDSDGKYTTEIRGLAQLLSQQFMETYGVRCSVKRFGDARCKLDITPYTHAGAVTSVTNRKSITTDLSISPEPDFRGGAFTFTSGANAGYMRESKSGVAGVFSFWEPFPNDIAPGDEFSAVEACDRTLARCIEFDNAVNFRGYGVFIPGIDALSKGPL